MLNAFSFLITSRECRDASWWGSLRPLCRPGPGTRRCPSWRLDILRYQIQTSVVYWTENLRPQTLRLQGWSSWRTWAWRWPAWSAARSSSETPRTWWSAVWRPSWRRAPSPPARRWSSGSEWSCLTLDRLKLQIVDWQTTITDWLPTNNEYNWNMGNFEVFNDLLSFKFIHKSNVAVDRKVLDN